MGRLPSTRPDSLASLIRFVRGERVMLDEDLAALYAVTTSELNKAVKRNPHRFPEDFVFRLARDEWRNLMFQIGISSSGHGGRRKPPNAFTEQGVAMLSSVLHSSRAIEVNVAIMRTFVQLRRLMDSNRELARKIEAMEKKYDEQFAVVFDAIKLLVAEDAARKSQPKRPIGFRP